MEPIDVQAQWIAYATKFGIPSFMAVFVYWAGPKLWGVVSARLGIAKSTTDLTQAGIGGITDVVLTLRTQITDLTKQFQDVEVKLQQMSDTLDQAVQDKIMAKHEAAKAKSDLYILQLYVERLRAQIQSLGATPIQQ